MTALPQPQKTSQKVPSVSAAILRGDTPGRPPGMVDPAPAGGSRRGWRRLLRG